MTLVQEHGRLLSQDYRRDYEIIVVDNGSTEGMARIAASFGARVVYETEKALRISREME